jgi:hypothetical protein
MVSIDNVYQKVLAFANKEQRGYITPQEFNLFAHQAQLEIFEQYFYDLNQFLRLPGNSEEYSNIVNNLREKIVVFETTGTISNDLITTSYAGSSCYRLGTVTTSDGIIVEEVQPDDNPYAIYSPLLKASPARPTYIRTGAKSVYITPTTTNCNCTYTRTPIVPHWGYFVVGNKALYNETNSVDFELHPSEESELVYKILKYAGISMKAEDIARGGGMLETQQAQQEKQ